MDVIKVDAIKTVKQSNCIKVILKLQNKFWPDDCWNIVGPLLSTYLYLSLSQSLTHARIHTHLLDARDLAETCCVFVCVCVRESERERERDCWCVYMHIYGLVHARDLLAPVFVCMYLGVGG